MRRASRVASFRSFSAPALYSSKHQLFGGPAAEHERQPRVQFAFADVDAVFLGQELRDAQRAAARNDRHLVHAIGARHEPGQQGMARLVVGGHLLFLVGQHLLALGPHQDLVAGALEVVHGHRVLALPGRPQGRFVDQVADVGAGQPDRAAARRSRSTSSASGTSRVWTLKICRRPLSSGDRR